MKVLVTGATGFVGSWLTKTLIDHGHHVSILSRKTPKSTQFDIDSVRVFLGDITDANSVSEAVNHQEVVFHLAGYIGYSKKQRQLMQAANVDGTAHVVQACLNHRVSRLIHMSSVVTIGACRKGEAPMDESSTYNMSSHDFGYFETKRQAEALVLEAVEKNGLPAIILNPSTIYGPGDALKGSRKTQIKVAQGRFPFFTEGGVSVVSVEDVIQALLAAVHKGRLGERYILCGENITIEKLFELIAECGQVPPPKKKLSGMSLWTLGVLGDILESLGLNKLPTSENVKVAQLYHWYRHDKATRELDFHPKPAAECIAESVGWMREQGFLEA